MNNDTNVENQVDNKLQNIDSDKKEQILSSFNEFQTYLSKYVQRGEKMGLGEEQMAKAAEKVAGYLAENEEPRNSEEKLLQELWKVGDQEQRHQLAHLLVRLVK
ncbi:MAG: DUF3243 domain-containing protein [Bacillus sp. (in: firmicutes)]